MCIIRIRVGAWYISINSKRARTEVRGIIGLRKLRMVDWPWSGLVQVQLFFREPEPEPQSRFRFSSGSNLVHQKKNTILYQ